MRFALHVRPRSIQELRDICRLADDLGIVRIGLWDSPTGSLEPWTALAAVASECQTLSVGTAVTNPLTRHPLVTAAAAATLYDSAPGRVYIGIGTGDSAVKAIGRMPASRDELRRYVAALRDLFSSGIADYHGERLQAAWLAGPRIPIYIAAHGPRTLRLAVALGDGVYVGWGMGETVVAEAMSIISRAAVGSKRPDIWFTTSSLHVGRSSAAAKAAAAWVVAKQANHLARGDMGAKGVPESLRSGIAALGDAYDMKTHGHASDQQRSAYVELAQRHGVLDYLMERYLIAGDPAEVAGRLRRLETAGVRQLAIGLTATDPDRLRRSFRAIRAAL